MKYSDKLIGVACNFVGLGPKGGESHFKKFQCFFKVLIKILYPSLPQHKHTLGSLD